MSVFYIHNVWTDNVLHWKKTGKLNFLKAKVVFILHVSVNIYKPYLQDLLLANYKRLSLMYFTKPTKNMWHLLDKIIISTHVHKPVEKTQTQTRLYI